MQDMGPHADCTCVCSTLLDLMGLTQEVAFASAPIQGRGSLQFVWGM